MNFLKWNNETMSIGIQSIDNQHKDLLKIINKLSLSINNNSQKKDIVPIINEFINYAEYHFSTEEELFDRFNYVESIPHKKEHALFLKKMLELKKQLDEEERYERKSAVEVAEQLFKFAISWFLNHIRGSDKEYVSLLKDNGIE